MVSKRVVLADVPPERKPERGYVRDVLSEQKPERGYVRMFPWNENRHEGTFAKTTLLRNRPFYLLVTVEFFWHLSVKCPFISADFCERSANCLLMAAIFLWMPWWTFRPRKKIFSLPPRNSPIRRRHPPGPSAPPPPGDPPSWNFQLIIDPPPGASDSPFPLLKQKKISETSTKMHCWLGVHCQREVRTELPRMGHL